MPKSSSRYAIQFVWNDLRAAVTSSQIEITRPLPQRDCRDFIFSSNIYPALDSTAHAPAIDGPIRTMRIRELYDSAHECLKVLFHDDRSDNILVSN